jgi:hypothetical protein
MYLISYLTETHLTGRRTLLLESEVLVVPLGKDIFLRYIARSSFTNPVCYEDACASSSASEAHSYVLDQKITRPESY